uniref:MEKHLA domain-containing protein n=1 Tax=Chenopodium quinoa TaxID=63459 RepID=A0A803NDF4_CHEQI
FMEVVPLDNLGHYREDMFMPGDIFMLQLCSGVDENVVGACAELVFAPIDASFSDDAPLLPSGFRIIPMTLPSPKCILDLTSALEVGAAGNKSLTDNSGSGSGKSVMTIAFQFAFKIHLQESVATMARQYVWSIISSVQKVASALSPSRFGSLNGSPLSPGTPEAQTLARVELLKPGNEGGESILKSLWSHFVLPFEGLDMLQTTLVTLQDITLEKIFDEQGRKTLFTELPQIMQQGFICLQGGNCISSMGRPISYERAVAWKKYTGDCLNFGLAAEQAKSEGYKVEIEHLQGKRKWDKPREG